LHGGIHQRLVDLGASGAHQRSRIRGGLEKTRGSTQFPPFDLCSLALNRNDRDELRRRGQLDLIKECLPVYYDPSRTPAVFGPAAPMVSQGPIERAIQTPAQPVRAIAVG
jgi:hypothetical protein